LTSLTQVPFSSSARDEIARTLDPELLAMKLCLSPQFDPRLPDWAALVPPPATSPWIKNLHARCAELRSLDEKAMAKLMKKRAKATVNEMNLFAASEDNEVSATDDETDGSGSTVDAHTGDTSATAIASGSLLEGQESA
jgi:hypothetical protein